MRRKARAFPSSPSARAWFAMEHGHRGRGRALLTLHVWSRAGGKKQVHDIIEAIKSTLHDQPLTLVDHHLINLRNEFSEARPDPDGDTFHGIVRYRAVTEPSQAQAAWFLVPIIITDSSSYAVHPTLCLVAICLSLRYRMRLANGAGGLHNTMAPLDDTDRVLRAPHQPRGARPEICVKTNAARGGGAEGSCRG